MMEQEQQVLGSSDGPVAIFWDIQNCDVPKDVRPEDVGGNIRMALRAHPVIKGAVVGFSAYGDFNNLSRTLREGCQRTGVKLVDVPSGRKDAVDKAILVDMFVFALDHPAPSSIMLISGDIDFAPALHVLGQRGYTVILVIPSGVCVSPALRNAGKFVLDWPSVAHGKDFVPHGNSPRNSRIVLEQERKLIPNEPARAIRDAFTNHSSDSINVTGFMPGRMEADLQKQHMYMNINACTVIDPLKEMFQERKTVSELHGMLQTAEKNIDSRTKDVLTVNKGISFKKAGSKKGKSAKQKDDTCLYCDMPGHWKRNCKLYLDALKKIGRASAS